jgi:hypothetical protein
MADCRLQIAEFCRDIESYLCKKNDGHLIRVVGPSFVVVSSWAERGVPLKVAYAGIDRYFDATIVPVRGAARSGSSSAKTTSSTSS